VTPPPDEPFQLTTLFNAYALHRAIGGLLEATMATSPLDPSDYALYSLIRDQPDQSPTELARRMTMPLTTMSDWLATLERRGHVARARKPTDRRSHGVSLTPAGRDVQEAAMADFGRAYLLFRNHLTVPESEVLAALAAAIAAVQRAHDELIGGDQPTTTADP